MNKNIIFFFINLTFLSFVFEGCSYSLKNEDSDFIEFNKEGMKPDFVYQFNPFESLALNNNSHNYSMAIIIRYTDKCKIEVLPLDIEWINDSKIDFSASHIDIPLFNNQGQVKGKGNYGVYEVNYPITEVYHPDEVFSVNVTTSEKETEGIISMGIVCHKLD